MNLINVHSPRKIGVAILRRVLLALSFTLLAATTHFSHAGVSLPPASFWHTNGPCVFRASLQYVTNVVPCPRVYRPAPKNMPPELRRELNYFLIAQQTRTDIQTQTNLVFDHYLPASLNHLVWTNVIARTNGKSTVIWSTRVRPEGWPGKPPQVTWNRDSLIWGLRGLTAISPSWEGEGYPGQIPITALTRRHGYTRGHHMGPNGFGVRFAGKKVWFLTLDNRIVERTITREVVRTLQADKKDYTIFLFNKALPESIEPMRVAHQTNFAGQDRIRYQVLYGAPAPLFKTEQTGHVSAELPGFTVPTWKGGDSGSPNMLPWPGELVFISGRSTSGVTAEMQADMDELCRLEGLNAKPYRLDWMDLSRFPEY